MKLASRPCPRCKSDTLHVGWVCHSCGHNDDPCTKARPEWNGKELAKRGRAWRAKKNREIEKRETIQ